MQAIIANYILLAYEFVKSNVLCVISKFLSNNQHGQRISGIISKVFCQFNPFMHRSLQCTAFFLLNTCSFGVPNSVFALI